MSTNLTNVANDLAAIRQKMQSTNQFDDTLRQLMAQIVKQNENEALYENWSPEAEKLLREAANESMADKATIEKQATEIERLTTLLEAANEPPSRLVAIRNEIVGREESQESETA